MVAMAHVAERTGSTSIAIGYLDDSYGRGLAEALKSAVGPRGLSVLAEVAFSGDDEQLADEADDLLADSPSVVAILGDAGDGTRLLDAVAQATADADPPIIVVNDALRDAAIAAGDPGSPRRGARADQGCLTAGDHTERSHADRALCGERLRLRQPGRPRGDPGGHRLTPRDRRPDGVGQHGRDRVPELPRVLRAARPGPPDRLRGTLGQHRALDADGRSVDSPLRGVRVRRRRSRPGRCRRWRSRATEAHPISTPRPDAVQTSSSIIAR